MPSLKSIHENIVWEKVIAFTIAIICLMLIAECEGRKNQPSPATEYRQIERSAAKSKSRNCHEETFRRYARPWTVIVCVENGLEYSIAERQPGSNWMNVRYPMIIDSLRNLEGWRVYE